MEEPRNEALLEKLDSNTLYLCMGSACHHKKVYDVLPRLQELIEQNCVRNKVTLKGSFCLGPCTEGVAAYYDGYLATGIAPETIDRIFEEELLVLIESHEPS
jgi:NADH:ubiquinone oxidoreductase subunit E